MAQENGAPSEAEKGKGKAGEAKPDKKEDEIKFDKDGKLIPNRKKGEEPEEGKTRKMYDLLNNRLTALDRGTQ